MNDDYIGTCPHCKEKRRFRNKEVKYDPGHFGNPTGNYATCPKCKYTIDVYAEHWVEPIRDW